MPRALVIGSPIGHSLSPLIHTAGYRAAGLDDWSYDRAEVTATEVPAFLASLSDDVRGVSVTMPCKEAALAFAAQASALAAEAGAANTLVRRGDSWHAENTDVAGVVGALRGAGFASSESAVVLGSGATARSVVLALAELGVGHVTFIVRRDARAETLDVACRRGFAVVVMREDDDRVPQTLAAASLILSTSPAHAADAVARRVTEADVAPTGNAEAFVLDVVYANWPTTLATVMEQRGARVVNGLDMLVHQAAAQFELFTGIRAPIADMMRAANDAVE